MRDSLDEMTEFLSSLKEQIVYVGGEMPVIHFQIPKGTPKERSMSFATAARREFPATVKLLFTTPGVKICVNRSKVINLELKDCSVSLKMFLENILKTMKEKSDVLNIRMENVTWTV